jgi:adenylosuccinate synthase
MITAITGAQFGDEGKGKITDFYSDEDSLVIRWSGGPNAGHTIQVNEKQYKLKLIPSGALRSKEVVITGNCLIDLGKLIEEINYLKQEAFTPTIIVDTNCSVILPMHKMQDQLNDAILNIGTTKSGIGPATASFVSRTAITIKDIMNHDEKTKIQTYFKLHHIDEQYLEENINETKKLISLMEFKNVVLLKRELILDIIKNAKNVIFEGAQGTMLDINHGTYPYCTSTPCLASAIPYVMGIGNLKIERNIGVFKPYITRVGNGEFPTEILEGPVKEHLQSIGKEVGTNTGRTRRVGWLDLKALKHACELNNFTELAMVKLDVLTGLETIAVLDTLGNWWNFDGWTEDITNCKTFLELPEKARMFLLFIRLSTNAIFTVSVGPDRNQTIIVEK